MERKSGNDFRNAFKTFIWKNAKEKVYYNRRNIWLSLSPIVVALLALFLIDKLNLNEETITQYDETFAPETQVN
jgi:hypothetical protein